MEKNERNENRARTKEAQQRVLKTKWMHLLKCITRVRTHQITGAAEICCWIFFLLLLLLALFWQFVYIFFLVFYFKFQSPISFSCLFFWWFLCHFEISITDFCLNRIESIFNEKLKYRVNSYHISVQNLLFQANVV